MNIEFSTCLSERPEIMPGFAIPSRVSSFLLLSVGGPESSFRHSYGLSSNTEGRVMLGTQETPGILTGPMVARALQRNNFTKFSKSQYYNISTYFLQISSLTSLAFPRPPPPPVTRATHPERRRNFLLHMHLGSYLLFPDLHHYQIGLGQTL